MAMVMARSRACCLPDILLWIEVRRRRRQIDCLKSRVGCAQLLDRFTAVPGGTVPEQKQRLRGISLQLTHQKEHSGVGVIKFVRTAASSPVGRFDAQ
jgi:hypothetical protein